MKSFCFYWILCLTLATGVVAQITVPVTSDQSVEQLRTQIAKSPDDTAAISALVQKLEQEGKWRETMPLLEHLLALQPKNSAALYQLGSMKSWEAGQRKESLDLLRRACETSDNNVEYCSSYAEVLGWRTEDRPEAITALQQLIAAHPENVSARLRLAQILSWDESSRAHALQIYEQGLKLDPNNLDLLIASAEVLSWSGGSRREALSRYDEALQISPGDARALTGKAQLLAWYGKTSEALQLYQQVLDKDPHNPAALRGKAEILNWRGRYTEARSLAEAARSATPTDERTRLELARANVGLHDYAAARQALIGVNGNPGPGFNDTRQEIHRGLGTWLEFGYADRREHALAYDRFALSLSTPLTPANRLTFSYQPTLFDAGVQGFNTNYFSASVDSVSGDRLSSHLQVGAETFNNAPMNFDGGFDLQTCSFNRTESIFSAPTC
jgi:tetratricopeptide (TPR) repeat protein